MANKPIKLIFKKSAAIAFVLLFSIAAAALLINMLSFSNSRENADFEWGGYARKDEQWWGSPECVEIADEMIRHQRPDGGWAKSIQTPPWDIWRHSTIDNTITWGQVRFLAKCYSATGKDAYRESCRRGISFLLNMQYENGGWPQIANAEGTYHAHITFNDDAMTGVMETLNMVSQRSETDGFGWMDVATAQKAGEAFDKGLDCILKCQIRVGGTLTAWCQQYDETTLSPASGRAYEPASICTKESSGVVKLLQKLPEKTPEVSAGIDAAIKWFDAVKIEGVRFEQIGDDRQLVPGSPEDVLWARFYQLDGATPLFADRDGEVFDDISKISMERRTGYAWYGIWPLEILE